MHLCYQNETNECTMFKVVLYEDRNGHSEIKHQISSLKEKSKTNKDARIQFRQIVLCIKLLEKNGLNLPINFLKHVQEDIWELRPGKNRILFFYYKDNTFVLLRMFRKKTQKTPKQEIEKALKEQTNYIERIGGH